MNNTMARPKKIEVEEEVVEEEVVEEEVKPGVTDTVKYSETGRTD